MLVAKLGSGVERTGFKWVALIVAVLFVIFETVMMGSLV